MICIRILCNEVQNQYTIWTLTLLNDDRYLIWVSIEQKKTRINETCCCFLFGCYCISTTKKCWWICMLHFSYAITNQAIVKPIKWYHEFYGTVIRPYCFWIFSFRKNRRSKKNCWMSKLFMCLWLWLWFILKMFSFIHRIVADFRVYLLLYIFLCIWGVVWCCRSCVAHLGSVYVFVCLNCGRLQMCFL